MHPVGANHDTVASLLKVSDCVIFSCVQAMFEKRFTTFKVRLSRTAVGMVPLFAVKSALVHPSRYFPGLPFAFFSLVIASARSALKIH